MYLREALNLLYVRRWTCLRKMKELADRVSVFMREKSSSERAGKSGGDYAGSTGHSVAILTRWKSKRQIMHVSTVSYLLHGTGDRYRDT